MNRRHAFAALLLGASAASPPAGAVLPFDPSSPIVVGAADFGYERTDAPYYLFDASLGYGAPNLALMPAMSQACAVAALDLPVGVTLSEMQVTLYDNDPSLHFDMALRRHVTGQTADSQVLATIPLAPTSASIQTLTASLSHTVQPGSTYFLAMTNCMDVSSQQRLYSVRLVHDDLLFRDGFASGDTNAWVPPVGAIARLGAAAFHDARPDSGGDHLLDTVAAFLWFPSDLVAGDCFVAPVRLVDGATLTRFAAWLVDAHATANLTLNLRRKQVNTGGTAEILATVATSGASAPLQTLEDESFSAALIDADLYTYYVEACFSGAVSSPGPLLKIYGAQVETQ